MITFDLIVIGILGFLGVTILDRIWFKIDYKKIEKGLAALEHYHWGIGLFALSFFFLEHIPHLAHGMLGMGAAFVYHESKQKNFFARTSSHFKSSSVIGIILAGITIVTYFYLVHP